MKFFAIAMILAVIACTMAFPTIEEYEVEERGDRHRRVTCDLLSWGGVVGDSACAANCLSMGKAGGSCNGAICQCRTTTFSDLWNKRFG
ncbi:defensin-like [Athalia rosae]|uniref:defensin-like n=1 Tax=Athalia rosae TaxID=37344 RepID=UPI000626C2B3|nr:defensin-like [Athalia rosae]